MKKIRTLSQVFQRRSMRWTLPLLTLLVLAAVITVSADVIGRNPPSGAVPNPGTQQQELGNITAPAPYNVFEFVVTCAGCHGGGVDQQAGHFSNWAGTSMASAARDPIFRAVQATVNETVQAVTRTAENPQGQDGAGNMCFRCHSPNGWYSGRFDPSLAGDALGETMMHSILLSTDDEGIMCEACHRVMGNVTFQDPAIDPADPAWNMLAGISDWPHAGGPFVDQVGDPTIGAGNPYGDTTLQYGEGMTYFGKYTGMADVYFSDLPIDPLDATVPSPYTGQAYAVYPPNWTGAKNPVPAGLPQFNSAGEEIVYNIDGSILPLFEAPIGPPFTFDPATGTITYDYQAQSLSVEHPTIGDRPSDLYPQPVPDANKFISSSEFCGTCHDLTVPILNHGMPEQRTYTEWKNSVYSQVDPATGEVNARCQDCHMPSMKHELADGATATVNVDPALAGWFPYAKDRAPDGGTAFHKFAGANYNLPNMMKELYPEPDLEVLGASTGNDPRVFPGMLSTRDPMYDRAQRNTEVSLQDAIGVTIAAGPNCVPDANDPAIQNCQVQVQVTNNAGHRAPSGYPDGRRFWIELAVKDAAGATVYQSGGYDPATGELQTAPGVPFNRALEPAIDSANNAVMVYERVTGTCVDANGTAIFPTPSAGTPASCTPSPALTNNFILFDNRPLAAGSDYTALRVQGVKFWNYDPVSMVPYEDLDRFANDNGANWDLVTYTFDAPADAQLSARAEVYWQVHTPEFMEHLVTSLNDIEDVMGATPRPEGPINAFMPGYPLTPSYLSDVIDLAGINTQYSMNLRDNWGGIAYAAWKVTGEAAPVLVGVADTAAAVPVEPVITSVAPLDSFTLNVTWEPIADADGYLVWVRYGQSDATADWDRLDVVYGTSIATTALNVGKTNCYKVQAFNGAGYGPESAVACSSTPTDLPLEPLNLTVTGSTADSISLSWFDQADNEIGFVIERQDVPVIGNFYEVARIPTPNNGGNGGVSWIDQPLPSGQCWNYRVAAYNAAGLSIWSLPVMGCTGGPPTGDILLTAMVISGNRVDLSWSGATGTIEGYRIERANGNGIFNTVFNVPGNQTTYSDLTVKDGKTYFYRVFAYNFAGSSPASNTVQVTTGTPPPAAPTNLVGTVLPGPQVSLTWTDNATTEDGFSIERSPDGVTFAEITQVGADVVSYTDAAVTTNTSYYYRVRAFSASGGFSDYSNTVLVVTPAEAPAAPSELVVTNFNKTSVKLAWRDNSTNELGFYLYRSAPNSGWVQVASLPANTTSYNDKGLTSKTTYQYRLQAWNNDGVSEFSETVTVTTK